MKQLSKKKKIVIGILTPSAALVLAFFILCVVTMGMYSPTFLGRVLTHFDSSVSDYKIFPERIIQKSDTPYVYEKNINSSLGDSVSVGNRTLNNLVKSTKTTSFIIAKNDKIVYEQYANGYNENSVNTSFSMAKSVVSLLIGKAIEDGYIKSVNEPIENYIEEFKDKKIGKTTIEDLLLMRSDIVYDEDKFLWFGDDSLTYWHSDLRKLALEHTQLTDKYNGNFHYNNYHPLLLGIILERSTEMTVSAFFRQEIWNKVGAEHDASWSLDSDKSGFEKMESGINFNAVDFLKIGSMVLHGGNWNGTQIINAEWLNRSTLCSFPLNSAEYKNTFLDGKNIGYKYMWYCTADKDLIAWGKSDQILYISPSTDTVILRTGKSDGGINWTAAIKNIIKQI
ncbi:MAG: beta-lactamase family protein [Clostridia bacterium]|nr:beta-lactamase family protein [Clostridia bacterium]